MKPEIAKVLYKLAAVIGDDPKVESIDPNAEFEWARKVYREMNGFVGKISQQCKGNDIELRNSQQIDKALNDIRKKGRRRFGAQSLTSVVEKNELTLVRFDLLEGQKHPGYLLDPYHLDSVRYTHRMLTQLEQAMVDHDGKKIERLREQLVATK